MKIIASSVRKGNVLEIDNKLYVVLSAESFFPGKGTPTTQIDMRRISDGVKTTERYRTTEQVERATVEEREQYGRRGGSGTTYCSRLRQELELALSCDHRVIDGVRAARFLQ